MNQASTTDENISLTEKQFKRDLRKVFVSAIITTLVGCAVSAFLTFVPFYFNTNSKFEMIETTQTAHTKNITDLTKLVQNLVTTSEVEKIKPENQALEIQELKKRMDRYEEKQDKIYELLLEIKQRNH